MTLKPFIRIDKNIGIHLARPELAAPIFEAVDSQREYLRQWLPWVDGTKGPPDTQAFIKESMQHNTSGKKLSAFITYDEKLVGSLSVVRFHKISKSCEIGYWLHKDSQGQGIMTKAAKGLINYLFKRKALNRIEIHAALNNVKSQAIPLRLGFKKEGILREAILLYGEYHDRVLFGLLRSEWEKMEWKNE